MLVTFAKQYFRETVPKYSLPLLSTLLVLFMFHDRIVQSIATSSDMELQLAQNVFGLSVGVQIGSCLALWLASFVDSLLQKQLVITDDYHDLASNALLVTGSFTLGVLTTVSSAGLLVNFQLLLHIEGWLLGLHLVAMLVANALGSLRSLVAPVTVALLLFQVGSVFAQTPEPTVHELELPSGAVATVTMTMTAGEIMVVAAIGFLITLQLWEVARSLTHLMTKR